MPDLVGIGSINVDVIISSAAAASIDLGDPRLGLTPADIGNEREVTPDRIERALGYLAPFDPVASPGGSALNVIAGVAATGAPVSVGHVGVRGTREPGGASLGPWLDRLGIDQRLIGVVDGPPGVCLSITRNGERTLLTTGGVNDGLGRFLTAHRDEVVDQLATARLVHLTSLAGLDDLEPLIDVVDEAGHRNDTVRFSCDPGAIWTGPDRPADAEEILGRCQQILVNRREYAAIGGGPADPDDVFDRWPAAELVVVKAADRVQIHHRRRDHGRPATTTYPNPTVLEADRIVDDTGSGDAFAAGFLIAQLTDHLDEAAGVELGMDLARAKLGFPGITGIDCYAELWRRFALG